MICLRKFKASIGLVMLIAFAGAAHAQANFNHGTLRKSVKTAQAGIGFNSGSLIVAPIPFTNDAIGSGITLGAGYLFSLEGAKPSGIGAAYFETNESSKGYGLGGSLNFPGGRWGLSLYGGSATLNYDLPVTLPITGDFDIPFSQDGDLISGRVNFAPREELSFSFGFSYLDTQIALDSPIFNSIPDRLRPDLDIELAKLHYKTSWDTRDNTFYPTGGVLLGADYALAKETDSAFGERFSLGERTYQKLVLSAAAYHTVLTDGVIAGRAVVCGSGSKSPFFDDCGLGFVDGVRGFNTLGYLADYSASLQAEFRGRISKRIGYVAFVGGGGSGDDFGDFSNSGVAAGVGLRFRLSQQFPVDYAVDYARNDIGEHYLYLTVGQSF